MEPISIKEILTATEGVLLKGKPETIICGVSTDSRKCMSDELFIPLKGERFDAHDFIPQALENGAKAVLVQRWDGEFSHGVQVIQVKDTLKALQGLAGYYRRKFHISVVAVTGSTGKTTAKDMIHKVLSLRYNVLKTEGNLNNEIGLPLTLLRLNKHHKIAVVEMGMSSLGEIRCLAKIAAPNIGVITNIGVSHIEKLGSRENILKAKMELFENFPVDGIAVLNGDDDLLWGLKERLSLKTEYFGTGKDIDFKAANVKTVGQQGISYQVINKDKVYAFELSVLGRHNVYNSLAAIAVGRLFGLDFQEMQEALKDFESGDMRLNVLTTQDGLTIIDDAYNASPDSMKAALTVLKDMQGNRKIAVLGDMLEMGNYAEQAHREVGQAVAGNIDFLITRGHASRWIGEGARAAGMPKSSIHHLGCNKDVINLLGTFVQSGDTILVKGSRGMKMEEVVSYLLKGRV